MIEIEVKFHSMRAGPHQNRVKGPLAAGSICGMRMVGGGGTATDHSPFDANGSVTAT